MWRPFASNLVEHSLDSFILKHEKGKGASLYAERPKRNTSPFKVNGEDLEQRLEMFDKLKKKVRIQRDLIKKNDTAYQKRTDMQLKYKRKTKPLQIGSLSHIPMNRSMNTDPDIVKGNSTSRNYVKNTSETPKTFGLPPIKKVSLID